MAKFSGLIGGALYFCDGGLVVCSACAGTTARTTGRDLSGQRIRRVTASAAAKWLAMTGESITCETCVGGAS